MRCINFIRLCGRNVLRPYRCKIPNSPLKIQNSLSVSDEEAVFEAEVAAVVVGPGLAEVAAVVAA